MTTPTYPIPTRAEGIERLRTLYAVLAGIPADKNRLYTYVHAEHDVRSPPTAKSVAKSCGSTACALGWAAMYPEFNELGLTLERYSELPYFNGTFDGASTRFFCLTEPESLVLFGPRAPVFDGSWSTYKAARKLRKLLYAGLPWLSTAVSDKRIALHRIRKFLEHTDAITPERSAELEAIERGY